jgi:hypothetical protein
MSNVSYYSNYTGPCDDVQLYQMPTQLHAGTYCEPNYQWIIDPQHFQNPSIQRLQMRTGFGNNAWQPPMASVESTNILQHFLPYA